MRRALAIFPVAALCAIADEAAPASGDCERSDLACWQELYASECSQAASTVNACLVFLQRLETARRGPYSTGITLLLGETLHTLARRDVSPEAQARYLERSRAAYGQAVKNEPFNASGYLGLAEVAETGEKRVEWLRGAVRAEHQPAHMELLANALSTEVGGHTGDLEAARVVEDAYTFESTAIEKWRYGASAWQRYSHALTRYPSAVSERSLENVVIRIKDDIEYPLLQRTLLAPEAHLAFLAGAFATMCEKSIAEIVSLDECMAGLELAVATAEASVSSGVRRLLAEATLTGMRTIAGESVPRSPIARSRFLDWIDRLLASAPAPVEVAVDLLEARADYTTDLPERAQTLLSAIELSPNRGDLRLKLGATYVDLRFWPEALEQLRVARFFLPPEEHERADKLAETADEAYQARFLPPDAAEASSSVAGDRAPR
jgi:hypothetical protein